MSPTLPSVHDSARNERAPVALKHSESAPGRLAGEGPVAIVDIGSNSVRLVVYEHASRAATPLFNEKELCGLARGVAETGRLSDAAASATLAAVRRFVALSNQLDTSSMHVLATAAVREADNGDAFVAELAQITQTVPIVLSGAEEARLAALGVVSGFRDPYGVVGDLGGGSLEVVSVDGVNVGAGETTPLGAIRLEELSGASPRKAEKIAAEHLRRSSVLTGNEGKTFYAIGGSWRALARLHMRQKGYPMHIMHHYTITAEEAGTFCKMVARSDPSALASIDIVSRARRALLPYGAAVLGQLVDVMAPSEVIMSALGVREGLLYDLLDEDEQARDPLLSACEELAYLRSRSPQYVEEAIPWTGMVFEAIGLDETVEEARLRHAACLLSDIGWRAHPEYRGAQSMDSIVNSSLIGVDHPGRAYIAAAAFFRHEGLDDDALPSRIREMVSTRQMQRARALGAALRVGHIISAGMPGVLARTRVDLSDNRLVLVLPREHPDLGGARVLRRFGQLAKMAGVRPEIEVE